MLRCRFIMVEKNTRPGFLNEFALLEVELKNVSDKAIEIRYTRARALLRFMKGEGQRPDGTIVKYNCADGLAPFSVLPKTLTLRSGEAIKEHFGSIGGDGPGLYRITALFEYEKMKAVSPMLEVDLRPLKKQ
jgi:hypothetical protein